MDSHFQHLFTEFPRWLQTLQMTYQDKVAKKFKQTIIYVNKRYVKKVKQKMKGRLTGWDEPMMKPVFSR
jgi:hypothetical protein